MIKDQAKDAADCQAEREQYQNDEQVQGNFKSNTIKEVKSLIGYEEMLSKKKNSKFVQLMCLVSWWPNPNEPCQFPMDSEESYHEVRQQAPRQLVEYFIKRTVLD